MAKKILIIDDSALMRRVISDIIKSDDQFEVADLATNGLEGFDKIVSNPKLYSAIILDINMPKMNGLELLEMLQKNRITQTIIVVSTVAKEGAKETIRALELGAFDFVTKPENFIEAKGDNFKNKLLNMLSVATGSNVQMEVVSRPPVASSEARPTVGLSALIKTKLGGRTADTQGLPASKAPVPVNRNAVKEVDISQCASDGANRIVALACSTGGPKSLQQVIPFIPGNIDAGIVIVQHMPAGFTKSLAARLDEMSQVNVKEAENGEIVHKGTVYIAPGGRHMKLTPSGKGSKIIISDDPPVDALRPCANLMYESLKDSSYDEIVCVVLTGMGADGTRGIKSLSGSKKLFVIGQNEGTSIVYGMPRAIAEAGLVNEVKPLEEIADAITRKTGVR